MTTKTHPSAIGQTAVRLAAVAVLALLVALALHSAGATYSTGGPITISQSAYVKLCKSTGGTASSSGSKTICSYAGGPISTCDFKTKMCRDVFQAVTPTAPGNVGPSSDGQTMRIANRSR